MLIFFHGISFPHLNGRVWVDTNTSVSWEQFQASTSNGSLPIFENTPSYDFGN